VTPDDLRTLAMVDQAMAGAMQIAVNNAMLMTAPGYGDDVTLTMMEMLTPQFAARDDLPELAAVQSIACAKVMIGREQANVALAVLHTAVLAVVRAFEAGVPLSGDQIRTMVANLHTAAEAAAKHLNEAVIIT